MLAPTERAPNRPPPLPSALLAAELRPAVMADDSCEAAFSAADPTGPRKYYRARYYDPKIGRFISEDPIGFQGGLNFYTYVENNPANWIDPWGLKVYRCCRDVEVNRVVNGVARVFRYKHCFIKTDTMEAGMGPAGGGPLPSCPIGTPTAIIPHTGQSAGSDCQEIPDADEDCVNLQLSTGGSTGPWCPWNNCNTVADDIICKCRPNKCTVDPYNTPNKPGGYK